LADQQRHRRYHRLSRRTDVVWLQVGHANGIDNLHLGRQRPGGTSQASASITVNTPVASVAPSPTDEELFSKNVKDVFFDYDKYSIRSDELPTVQTDEAFLVHHPNVKVLVEGHCDDRGSEEYNIALGASRSESVKQSLVREGIPADRIRTVSYGKEKPFCHEENEQCWQQNRVGHFAFDH
jgi:peptidoglycan-associated lipoprotein